jgi:predicted nucleic acid-binding protein
VETLILDAIVLASAYEHDAELLSYDQRLARLAHMGRRR